MQMENLRNETVVVYSFPAFSLVRSMEHEHVDVLPIQTPFNSIRTVSELQSW